MVQSLISALVLGMVSLPSISQFEAQGMESISIAQPAVSLPIARHLSASGVLVMDASSGQRMFGKQVSIERSMASITKLMTALVIIEHHDLGETVTIPADIENVIGNKAYLAPGEHFYLGDLLSAMLISSANDAARTLARYHSGSIDGFVEEMNARAVSLGLRNTHFANPDGLDGIEHYSTPQDIAWLMQYVLKEPEIRNRMSTTGMRISSFEGSIIPLTHTHAFIHSKPQVIAGKTGTTDSAGECLASLVELNGKEYIVVILNSLQRYTDMQTILTSLTQTTSTKVATTVSPSSDDSTP